MKIKVIASDSKANCYVLFGESSNLIIEAGCKRKKIIEMIGSKETKKIEFGLITHEHKDHSRYINEFKGVKMFSSQGTKDELRRSINVLQPLRKYKIGEWEIKAFPVCHDSKQPCGYLIRHKEETILFALDTAKINYIFRNVNYFLVEANYKNEFLLRNYEEYMVDRIQKNHMEIDNLITWLKTNDLSKTKKIILLHLSHKNADVELFKFAVETQLKISCGIGIGGFGWETN